MEQTPSSCVGVMDRGPSTFSSTLELRKVVLGPELHERLLKWGQKSRHVRPPPPHTRYTCIAGRGFGVPAKGFTCLDQTK